MINVSSLGMKGNVRKSREKQRKQEHYSLTHSWGRGVEWIYLLYLRFWWRISPGDMTSTWNQWHTHSHFKQTSLDHEIIMLSNREGDVRNWRRSYKQNWWWKEKGGRESRCNQSCKIVCAMLPMLFLSHSHLIVLFLSILSTWPRFY